MDADKNFLVGVFDDEDVLLNGVTTIRQSGVKIHEVYSPFPVHGLDEVLGYRRSRLPIAAFMFGITGTSLGLVHADMDAGIRLADDHWRKELCFPSSIRTGDF